MSEKMPDQSPPVVGVPLIAICLAIILVGWLLSIGCEKLFPSLSWLPNVCVAGGFAGAFCFANGFAARYMVIPEFSSKFPQAGPCG